MNKEKMSHNACTVNLGSSGTLLIWLHSFKVDRQVFFRYSFSFAGATFSSSSFNSICCCYSSIIKFIRFICGCTNWYLYRRDDSYFVDQFNTVWSDVVFKSNLEVA